MSILKNRDLKPCPFCGCKRIKKGLYHENFKFVQCTECRIRTLYYPDGQTAIDLWNKRIK